jgi:hypothetical protein
MRQRFRPQSQESKTRCVFRHTELGLADQQSIVIVVVVVAVLLDDDDLLVMVAIPMMVVIAVLLDHDPIFCTSRVNGGNDQANGSHGSQCQNKLAHTVLLGGFLPARERRYQDAVPVLRRFYS